MATQQEIDRNVKASTIALLKHFHTYARGIDEWYFDELEAYIKTLEEENENG